MADMTDEQIAAHLMTLTDAQIMPDGSQGFPGLTTSDVTKMAGHYKGGIIDPVWMQIQEPGAGGLPYTKDQMARVIRACEREVKRRQGG